MGRGRWGISQCDPPLVPSPSGFLESRIGSLTCKRGAPIKAVPPPEGTDTTAWALSPRPRAAPVVLLADSARSGVLKGLRVGGLPGGGGEWGQRVRGLWPCPVTVAHPQISKPLMEKKRRARINVSLEQLKSLLEKHYSHQVRHRNMVVVVLTRSPASSPPTRAAQL